MPFYLQFSTINNLRMSYFRKSFICPTELIFAVYRLLFTHAVYVYSLAFDIAIIKKGYLVLTLVHVETIARKIIVTPFEKIKLF